jgi:hypothetical protein
MAENILFCNVRVLNVRAHGNAVRELIDAECISLVCLQETKLDSISDFDVIQLFSSSFDYVFLPAVHMCGGILVAWHNSASEVTTSSSRSFLVLIRWHRVMSSPNWWLSTVYGPCRDEDKPVFLVELHELRQVQSGPWLLGGNFNMIYLARDKNKNRVNWRRMGQFCHFLNSVSL